MFEVNITRAPAKLLKPTKEIDMFELTEADVTPKQRIRAFTKEYYKWIGNTATKLIKKLTREDLIEQSSGGEPCPKCKDSDKKGHWFFRKEQKWCKCGRCAGKGYVTSVDKGRFSAYSDRITQSLQMDTSYVTYA